MSSATVHESDVSTLPEAQALASIQTLPAPSIQFSPDVPNIDELVRLRAYELYERRGYSDGHALDDWLAAESELCKR